MQYSKVIGIKLISIIALCTVVFSAVSGVEDIVNTKHNLSASGPGTLKATTESRVCVFCHTPHGSTI
ncbi:Cytochrome c family protein, partial [hydrothermal vent metagenome]